MTSCGGEKKVEAEAPVEVAPVEESTPAAEETPVVEDSVSEETQEVVTPVEETTEVKEAIAPKEEVKPVEKVVAKVEEKVEEVVATAPAMKFEKTEFNFGEINQGDKVSHTFSFTNTGDAPLIISNARASCGCTVPKWPREPIAPGQTSKIDVVFNSAGKRGRQTKSITITTNIPEKAQQQVFLKGMVNIPEAKPVETPAPAAE